MKTFSASADTVVTSVTVASEQLCHFITDGDLERVAQVSDDPSMPIFLAATGAFLGAVVPAVDGLSRLHSKDHPLGVTDLVSIFIASMALGLAIVFAILWRISHKKRRPIVDQIKGRPKVQLSVVGENLSTTGQFAP